MLNIGLPRRVAGLTPRIGAAAALRLYRRFIAGFAHAVHGLDPDDIEALAVRRHPRRPRWRESLKCLSLFEERDRRALAARRGRSARGRRPRHGAGRAAPSARILRRAKGAPEDAGLGLVIQRLALASAPGSAAPAAPGGRTAAPAPRSARAGSGRGARRRRPRRRAAGPLDELDPAALAELDAAAAVAAGALGDACLLEFVVEAGELAVLDAVPVRRNARAAVRIAVDLARAGAITRDEALLRIEPRSLVEHLHPQIDPAAPRDVFATGLAASPGAAPAASSSPPRPPRPPPPRTRRRSSCALETSPEDIRGMHAARGVLTIRGGMSSHAAVIARGLGLPCVVGASELRLDPAARTLTTPRRPRLREGALITLDGTRGEVMAGAPPMIPPELGGAFSELLDWADAVRDMACAPTPTPPPRRAWRASSTSTASASAAPSTCSSTPSASR